MASILTSTGVWFDTLNPKTESINIVDIANSLSKLCRFGGHCKDFYSVAEHSIHVSRLAHQLSGGDINATRWGLLHDASEAYVVDIPKPIKLKLPQYVEIEEAIQVCVADRFKLSRSIPDSTHVADRELLALELRAYMPPQPDNLLPKVRDSSLMDWLGHTLPPSDAMEAFLVEARLLGLVDA